jgi:hypothetical protein
MRQGILALASAVTVALCCTQAGLAQPPNRKGPPDRRGGGLDRVIDDLKLPSTKRDKVRDAARAYEDNVRRLTDLNSSDLMMKLKDVLGADEFAKLSRATERARGGPAPPSRDLGADAIVERILSFDKNKDGKVTKDELPERMQYLIEKGDTNKDGALDRDEIKKLAAEMAKDEAPRRGPARNAAAGRLTPRDVERALDDLKLSSSKKESAAAAVKACKEGVRKLEGLARADLLLRIDGVLDEGQTKKLTEALDRLPADGGRRGPPRDR